MHARQAVAKALQGIAGEVVHASVEVVHHAVRVDLIVVDDPQRAAHLEQTMALQLSAATGVVAEVHAMAVPNAAAVHEALQVARESRAEPVAPADLRRSASRLAEALATEWPADAAGALFDWRLNVDSNGRIEVDVIHLGAGLGRAGEQMLERDLSTVAGGPVRVHDVALPSKPQSAAVADGAAWFAHIAPVLDELTRSGSLYACIGVPPSLATDGGRDASEASPEATGRRVMDAAARVPGERARVAPDTVWTLRVQTEACPAPAPSADGGPLDDTVDASLDASAEGRHD